MTPPLRLSEILDRLAPEFLRAAALKLADSAIIFGSAEYAMALKAAAKAKGVAEAAPGLELTRAAVLVGFVDRSDGPTVLLTQRTAHLTDHGGQISFPGGRMEKHDADAAAAALRETEEEVGLTPSCVSVMGALEDYGTISGYRVTPVVGVVNPPFTLRLDPFEVAEAFEVPFAHILDPGNRIAEEVRRGDIVRQIWSISYDGRRIWGFTARILVALAEHVSKA
jgi:8-oxo-dGTP pyrophosphatase MutT (NUDIX family)